MRDDGHDLSKVSVRITQGTRCNNDFKDHWYLKQGKPVEHLRYCFGMNGDSSNNTEALEYMRLFRDQLLAARDLIDKELDRVGRD